MINNDSNSNDETITQSKNHWTNVYNTATIERLGWYESNPLQSLNLIKECNLAIDAKIFNAGAGATTLVDELIKLGYQNIIANDISKPALDILEKRIGTKNSTKVAFIEEDLANPNKLLSLKEVDLWHDRAVLHFLTKEDQQKSYFNLLKKVVKPKGFVIIAEFNLEGAKKCSGLNVVNYDVAMIKQQLGTDFNLLKSFDFIYTMPSGDKRPYIYTLFKRK